MLKRLHIVASCTDRKRTSAGDPIRLRDVAPGKDRARRWWCTLTSASGPTMAARELYVGSYWSIIRDLRDVARQGGWKANTWVASGGYGLVPEDAHIRCYSATFSTRQADAIAPELSGAGARDAHRRWWVAIAKHPLGESKTPRSIAELARSDRRATILVVGSPDYIAAMEDDLVAACDELDDTERLIVVTSPGRRVHSTLEPHLVPSDARLLSVFGRGSRVSLHALTVDKILKESTPASLRAPALRAQYRRLLAELPAYEQPQGRVPRSDDDVRAFIRTALRTKPRAARTPLLRELRSSGHQCEQKRFKRLFEEVAASHAQ